MLAIGSQRFNATNCESATKARSVRFGLGRAQKINHNLDLPGGAPRRGRRPTLHRAHLEGILWILRTGAPWRDLPAAFGPWPSVYSSFRRWAVRGLWPTLLQAIGAKESDREYLMIDSTSVRVHPHAAGPVGGQLAHAMGRSRAGLSTKLHFAGDALGYPLGFVVTAAPIADYHQAKPLLRRFLRPGAYAILDKGYDGDCIRQCVSQLGGNAVIALNSARSHKPPFDEHLYRERHRIENMFARLKGFRRIATRYEKTLRAFTAMLALACICLWIRS